MITSAPHLPLRLGTGEEFERVRSFFKRAGFDDVAALCRLLGIEEVSDLGKAQWEKFAAMAEVGGKPMPEKLRFSGVPEPDPQLSPQLLWCVQVLLRGLTGAESEARAVCGEEVYVALRSLGLLCPARKDPSKILCPAWVYPADGFLMVSDRRDDPEESSFTPPEDVVFPAIYAGTLRFLKLLPDGRGGEALDLCGGSGIGAFHLARTARAAATADLTPRSAFFAEFNAHLNGVAVESLCGDLYDPVAGRQFDLIAAHPPFVPASGPTMIYRDGGDTGEEITRRIIEGLPAHLRPGGTCVVLCVARDTGQNSFEARVREWLGAPKDEFDVIFGLEKTLTVEEVVESMRRQGPRVGDEVANELLSRLHSLDTRQFVYGALFIRRYAERVAWPPLRTRLTLDGRAVDFERVLAWRNHCRRPDFDQWLAASKPCMAPNLVLTARHVVRNRELVPGEFVFSITGGFEAAMRPEAIFVPLVARLEGKLSVAEIIERARMADELPAGFALKAFLPLVQRMIERGLLEVDFPAA